MGGQVNRELSVTMFTPWRNRCGIRDYSSHLLTALNSLPGIATHVVEAPADAVRSGLLPALRYYCQDERRFAALGMEMNQMSPGHAARIAHVQHQYFFFGGVGPHKTHIRAFLKAVRVPLVMTVHEIAQAKNDPGEQSIISLANRINFMHAAVLCFMVHTEADRHQLLRMGLPQEKVRLVRHGVPPALPLPEALQAKRAWNFEGKRVLTLFGFLSNKKGHRIALEALSMLPPDIILLFAGGQHPDDNTSYVSDLRAEIGRRDLAERVLITGYLADEKIPQIMALTDAALAPFIQSSGSGSLANLFAYGRAIVASDIAPHKELVSENQDAMLLYSARNAQSLADAIMEVLDDRVKRKRLEQAALKYAASHSFLVMARETLAIYREFASH